MSTGTALITGASSGIGAEFAKLYAAAGYDLVLVARRLARLEEIGADLTRRHGVRCEAVELDLSDREAPRTLAARLPNASVDVLVNNAGFGRVGAFADSDPAAVERMIAVNISALTALTRLFVPAMVSRGRGGVLNVASTAGFVPGPLMAVYYATKAYVISFTEALAEELRGSGVRVTVLCPGPTTTEFQTVSGMQSARLFRMPGIMDAASVARAGYLGLARGRRMVVPGPLNKLTAFAPRVSPRGLVPRVVRLLQQRFH
ncbi:MAG TPA: SDR family oxidoreductase [Gemmatimonadales bacterium]|nr:SDR family oxidoreductase [Gemmatimonadales bacterium]